MSILICNGNFSRYTIPVTFSTFSSKTQTRISALRKVKTCGGKILCSKSTRTVTTVTYGIGTVASKRCCVSGMVYPGSRILIFTHTESRISDPGSKNSKKRKGEKNLLLPFFAATNFTKLNIILFLKWWRKKFGPIFKELLKFLPIKLPLSSQKYGFGIRIRDPKSEKTYSGSRIQGSKRHRIPDPQHCLQVWNAGRYRHQILIVKILWLGTN